MKTLNSNRVFTESFVNYLRNKLTEAVENDFTGCGPSEFTVTPRQAGMRSFTEDSVCQAQSIMNTLFEPEYNEWDATGPQGCVELVGKNMLFSVCYNVG